MLAVIVFIHVKSECRDDFIAATIENARNSINESGIARFDFVQQKDDPDRFVLFEVYKEDDAPARHKETEHYLTWRETVADMMAEDRYSIKYSTVFPTEGNWG